MEHNDYESFMEKLLKNHASYILITCDEPESDGRMNVNMSHEGDSYLVSYLINTAQAMIDEKIDGDISESSSNLRLVK
ncbi:MAG: hypothetical protein K940chlam3_00717 [Chlamydiae bacterium]|nr:hypothetical protein [Chlamydiota bacterium]